MTKEKKKYAFVFIVVIIVVFGILILLPNRDKNKPKPLNVLLITIDALRPDHLGCYGYKRNTSPNIDRLTREGVIFTQAISQASLTVPSLNSIITSAYLSRHGVFLLKNQTIPDSIPTVVEILKKRGYATGFLSGRGDLRNSKKDAFSRAFDISEAFGKPASEISQKAIRWIEENKDKNFFLWLHYFDPHGPYTPPEPYQTKYLQDDLYRQNKHIPISMSGDRKGEIPQYVAERNITDIDYYIASYDGEISFVDEQIGILLETIKKLDLLKNTLIIITADHGEYLGEHNSYFMHGDLYDTVIRVPLILQCEDVLPSGKIVNQQVSLIDIMPTIIDLLKIRVNIKMDGTSLVPVIFGRYNNIPYAFSEFRYPPGVFLKSIRNMGWKLIYDVVHSRYELYNLKEDPQESNNLVGIEREQFRFLKSKLEKWMHRQKTNTTALTIQLDEQTKNRLRSLGYMQ